MLRRRPLRKINFEKRESLTRFLCSVPRESSGEIWGQSVKFSYLINSFTESALAKMKWLFSASKVLLTFHTLAVLVVYTVVLTANRNPGIEMWDYCCGKRSWKLVQCMAKAKFVFLITVLYFMVFTFALACLVFPSCSFALKYELGTF